MTRDELAAKIYLNAVQKVEVSPYDSQGDRLKTAHTLARNAFVLADIFSKVLAEKKEARP